MREENRRNVRADPVELLGIKPVTQLSLYSGISQDRRRWMARAQSLPSDIAGMAASREGTPAMRLCPGIEMDTGNTAAETAHCLAVESKGIS